MIASNDASAQQLLRFLNNRSPVYMDDVFKPTGHPNTNTRGSFFRLIEPLRNTNYGQKTLSYMAPNIRNSLPVSLKATECLNTYKHKIKKHFLKRMKNNESDTYSTAIIIINFVDIVTIVIIIIIVIINIIVVILIDIIITVIVVVIVIYSCHCNRFYYRCYHEYFYYRTSFFRNQNTYSMSFCFHFCFLKGLQWK